MWKHAGKVHGTVAVTAQRTPLAGCRRDDLQQNDFRRSIEWKWFYDYGEAEVADCAADLFEQLDAIPFV